MVRSILSLVRKFFHRNELLDAAVAANGVEFSLEELEARRLPAADITSLLAVQGTSAHDPVVSGYVAGDPIVGIELEFDRNGDSIADGSVFLEQGLGDFSFDLRALDPTLDDFEGSLSVRARAIELDGEGAPVAAGEWASTEFFLFGPPPTIGGFSAGEGAGDVWTFSGSVGGPHAAGATVQFGGVLAGQSVQADSSGNFTFSTTLENFNGAVTAMAVDSLSQESEIAEVYCESVADPVVATFSGSEGPDDTWTVSGTVTGPTALNTTVQFGGVLAGYSAQTDGTGYFSATFALGNVDGTATAQAIDGDGRVSNVAEFYCVSQPEPPESWALTSFSGVEEYGDYWSFSGTVYGNTCAGATVTFGGVLAGHTAQVDAAGSFCFSAYLGNIDGYATADIVDPAGQTLHGEVYCVSQPDPPETWELLSFSGVEEEGDYWSFSGAISGNTCAGATVTFGGVLAGQSVQVDSSGSFSLSVYLGTIDGYAMAEVVDPAGQTLHGEVYCVSLPEPEPDPLVITAFSGGLQPDFDNFWCFSGSVTGTHASGATVSFGGALAGYSAQVDGGGNFTLSLVMPGLTGVATAVAGSGSEQSNTAEYYLLT